MVKMHQNVYIQNSRKVSIEKWLIMTSCFRFAYMVYFFVGGGFPQLHRISSGSLQSIEIVAKNLVWIYLYYNLYQGQLIVVTLQAWFEFCARARNMLCTRKIGDSSVHLAMIIVQIGYRLATRSTTFLYKTDFQLWWFWLYNLYENDPNTNEDTGVTM